MSFRLFHKLQWHRDPDQQVRTSYSSHVVLYCPEGWWGSAASPRSGLEPAVRSSCRCSCVGSWWRWRPDRTCGKLWRCWGGIPLPASVSETLQTRRRTTGSARSLSWSLWATVSGGSRLKHLHRGSHKLIFKLVPSSAYLLARSYLLRSKIKHLFISQRRTVRRL